MKNKIIMENMEVKVLMLRKKVKGILQTIEYLVNDLNKLNASEEAKLEN